MKKGRAQEEDAVRTDLVTGIERLSGAPVAVFWYECFLRSAFTKGKSFARMYELGSKADACGRMCGQRMRAQGKPISELCMENGLNIRELAMPESPVVEIFAFYEAPADIFIRSGLLNDCDHMIHHTGMNRFLGEFRCMDVILCHEFFHFLETRDSGAMFTRAYQEPVGFFRKKTCLPPLSEIAAMGFAQEFLELDWSPFLLDALLLSVNDAQAGIAMLERFERAGAEYAQHGRSGSTVRFS